MSARVKELLADIAHLERELGETVKADYPIGAPIKWKNLLAKGGTSSGRVVDHGYRDRIKVHNTTTGKQFWIEAPRIA